MDRNDRFTAYARSRNVDANPDTKNKIATGRPWPSEDDGYRRAGGGAGSPGGTDLPGVNVVPEPPDGGYGWVIVVACFICNGVVEGCVGSFGVFLPHFAEAFGASHAKTAIAGSLLIGGFLISGAVVSGLINCLGCRLVTMTGAALTGVAFTLSTLSPHINGLIIIYGFFGGFGLAMIYLPAMVMVGYYFERRRPLATGIAYSGAGIGLFIMAPVAGALLSSYDWRNALMLLAAFPMQCLVLGALMRPLAVSALSVDDQCETTSASDADQKRNLLPAFRSKSEPVVNLHEAQNGIFNQIAGQHLSVPGEARSMFLLPGKHGFTKQENKPCCIENLKPPSQSCSLLTQSCVDLSSGQHSTAKKLITHTVHDRNCAVGSVTMIRRDDRSGCAPCSTVSSFTELLQCGLFFHPLFLIICLASVFIQLGYFIPVVFISDYALSLDIPEQKATLLISVIGLANTVGRASAGALGNLQCVNALHLNNLSLVVSGVATLLVCTVCKTYTLLVIYASIFGLFMGVFVPLTTIFLVKYLGLHRLNNAMGLLSMVRGLSSMAGPPIAGVLLDSYGSHSPIFYFAGAMFVIAGCIFYFILLCERCTTNDGTSPGDDDIPKGGDVDKRMHGVEDTMWL